MKSTALPIALALKWGNLKYVQYRGSGEYSAECPKCGDYGHIGRDSPDRFRMWESPARGWCRSCHYFEFADGGDMEYDPAREAAAIAERLRLAKAENRRIQAKITELNEQAYWRGYHDGMGDAQRGLWRSEGIPDGIQDWFSLGYCQEKPYDDGEAIAYCPALTIPYFKDDRDTVVNVQYKLLIPQEQKDIAGKYRPTAGLPSCIYYTEPEADRKGTVLVTEGAKKGIVTWMHLGGKVDQVVAVPSKYPSSSMIDELSQYDEIILALDPDASRDNDPSKEGSISSTRRIAKAIGLDKTRVVNLPMKIDDLFINNYANADVVWNWVGQARRFHD